MPWRVLLPRRVLALWSATVLGAVCPAAAARPRWCGGLAFVVGDTRARLAAKYGSERLSRASIFSHNASAVSARLKRSLETGAPFRVGVMGGSHAVPRTEGSWSANVTRWLDAVLGAAAGDGHYQRLVGNPSCNGSTEARRPYLRQGCARAAGEAWAWEPPAFCEDASTWHGDVGHHRHPFAAPLKRTCDNSEPPRRKCLVFWGSGAFATVVNGAQGDTKTTVGAWALSRALLPGEGLDVLFWDHGVNDFQDLNSRGASVTAAVERFAERAATEFPRLAGLFGVFWQDSIDRLRAACAPGNTARDHGWTADIPKKVVPALQRAAHRRGGVGILTMSLPAFCAASAGNPACHPMAFLRSNHPSALQHAAFADLVIWQFLGLFDEIMRESCAASTPPAPAAPAKPAKPAAPASPKSPRLESGFFSFSPIASPAALVGDVALLCTSAIRASSAGGRSYSTFGNTTLGSLIWTALAFDALMPACAGWNTRGARHAERSDAKYYFSATVTPRCPSGGGGGAGIEPCAEPPRSVGRYATWPQLPMVHANDVALRIALPKHAGMWLCSTLFPPGHARFLVPDGGGWVAQRAKALERRLQPYGAPPCLAIPPVSKRTPYVIAWCPAEECFETVQPRGRPAQGHSVLHPSILILDPPH
ncbi:hypothetical protein M885DRAFT_529153 [Pelagophyceae sp. CCMP2097]|nr:hypothetical protein M885DRAFT_529153 [Pelagophyceae sp. CCMP2097]